MFKRTLMLCAYLGLGLSNNSAASPTAATPPSAALSATQLEQQLQALRADLTQYKLNTQREMQTLQKSIAEQASSLPQVAVFQRNNDLSEGSRLDPNHLITFDCESAKECKYQINKPGTYLIQSIMYRGSKNNNAVVSQMLLDGKCVASTFALHGQQTATALVNSWLGGVEAGETIEVKIEGQHEENGNTTLRYGSDLFMLQRINTTPASPQSPPPC